MANISINLKKQFTKLYLIVMLYAFAFNSFRKRTFKVKNTELNWLRNVLCIEEKN